MLTIVGILFYLMLIAWISYSDERHRRKFHEQRHEFWHKEAKLLREAMVKKKDRVDGDEWKDICGY